MQVTRVETTALVSDTASVSAKKGFLELCVKVTIHNLTHLTLFSKTWAGFKKPRNFTGRYAVYWSQLTAAIQCSLHPVL